MYQAGKKETKTDLALKLFEYCLYTLQIQPKGFLFDSFYASDKIMKYLDSRGFKFYSQCKTNRVLNGTQVHTRKRPYWTEQGKLKDIKLSVQVTRHRKKYFITNDLEIDGKKQRTVYRIRWKIEEVFRFIKSEPGFEKCECHSLHKQNNHFGDLHRCMS
ncbi:MAG: transposase [Candidatus Dojkabacteria bacterium]